MKLKKFGFWLLILLLANLLVRGPDLYKFISKPEGKWYTSQASWFDPWDINVYASAIGWGKKGEIILDNPYDTTATQGVFVHVFYTLVGWLTSPLKISNFLIFHLTGVVTTFILAFTCWWFLKIFLKKDFERKVALFLLLFGGGFGWAFFPKTYLPDIAAPGFTFANALRRPHEAVSLSLFLITLASFWQAGVNKKTKSLAIGVISSFLTLFLHPYNLIPFFIIFGASGIWWWRKKKSLEFWKPLGVLAFLGFFYYILVARGLLANHSFSGMGSLVRISLFSFNGVFATPIPPAIILGWGLLFPLACITLIKKATDDSTIFLKVWFWSHFLAIYLPVEFQRLMLRGFWAVVVILAVKGLGKFSKALHFDYRSLMIFLLILSSFSTILISAIMFTKVPEARWQYLTQNEGQAIAYLKINGNPKEGVLASYRISNIIPAYTSKKVWAGHFCFSPNFEERENEVKHFFQGMEQKEAKAFLEKTGSIWVFWGPDEKDLAGLSAFPYPNLVEPMIENEVVSLYRVIK
jgi:hypothetical protein